METAPGTAGAVKARADVGPLRSATCVHALPGRLRLRIRDLKRSPDLARSIEQRLGRMAGVRRVEANPVTGSILVVYDENLLDRRDVFGALLAWDVVVDAPLEPAPPVGQADARGAATAPPPPATGVGRRLVGAVVRSGVEAAVQSAVQSALRALLA
jgi:copper chaperone CopZ